MIVGLARTCNSFVPRWVQTRCAVPCCAVQSDEEEEERAASLFGLVNMRQPKVQHLAPSGAGAGPSFMPDLLGDELPDPVTSPTGPGGGLTAASQAVPSQTQPPSQQQAAVTDLL